MNGPTAPDLGTYCREVETYLCRRNGGHLVRIVGPAFDLVSAWRRQGIPLKIVFRGIDRRLERQQPRTARRRPVRLEFCEADVLDAFDEWRRAVGALAGASRPSPPDADADATVAPDERARGPSLPAHLQRAQLRLTSLLASAAMPADLRLAVDRTLTELDEMRHAARTARGRARAQLLERLRALDVAVLEMAWRAQTDEVRAAMVTEGEAEVAAFRDRMPEAAWRATVEVAARRALRERLGLPTLGLE